MTAKLLHDPTQTGRVNNHNDNSLIDIAANTLCEVVFETMSDYLYTFTITVTIIDRMK